MSIQNGKFTARWHDGAGHSVTAAIIGDYTLPPLKLPRERGEVIGQTGGVTRIEAVSKNQITGTMEHVVQIMLLNVASASSTYYALEQLMLDALPATWVNVNNLPSSTCEKACYYEVTATDGASCGVSQVFTWMVLIKSLPLAVVNQHHTAQVTMAMISDCVVT